MSEAKNLRAGADRRAQPRGGRRPADVDGLAPLIMVVGDQTAVGDAVGAVLAKLKFAVIPSPTLEDALRVLMSLHPDLVVAAEADAARVRLECPEHHPVLVVSDGMRDNAQLLVDEVRTALRAR